jgi:hypothetical protein
LPTVQEVGRTSSTSDKGSLFGGWFSGGKSSREKSVDQSFPLENKELLATTVGGNNPEVAKLLARILELEQQNLKLQQQLAQAHK